jgi:hypothetical protein
VLERVVQGGTFNWDNFNNPTSAGTKSYPVRMRARLVRRRTHCGLC